MAPLARRTRNGFLVHEAEARRSKVAASADAKLVVEILTNLVERLFDGLRSSILFHAVAGKHLNVDDRPVHPVGTRRRISHPTPFPRRSHGGAFLRRQADFAFGVTLPTKMSPGVTSAPTYTTGLVELISACSPTLGMSPEISSGPSFVSGDTSELLDVNGGEAIFLHHALGNKNGVLEVVAVQGMKAMRMFWPRASSPRSTEGPSASTSPGATTSPCLTRAR